MVSCSGRNFFLVEVNPLPIVTAGTDQTICQGSPIILTGSGANTYSWNKNVVNAIPFQLQNTDTFTVVGTDLKGCVDTDQVIVKIDPIPPQFAPVERTDFIVRFTATGRNIFKFRPNLNIRITLPNLRLGLFGKRGKGIPCPKRP